MVAVEDRRGLAEHAALADRDRRRALDQDVVGELRVVADRQLRSGRELAAKATAKLDPAADRERRRLGGVQAEPGPEIDRTRECDLDVRVARQQPALSQPRHRPRAVAVAEVSRHEQSPAAKSFGKRAQAGCGRPPAAVAWMTRCGNPARLVAKAHLEAPVDGDVVETGAADHRLPGPGVGYPPDAPRALAAKLDRVERQQAQLAAVLLGEDQTTVAERGHALERQHRISQVDQDRAAEDEVERPPEQLCGGVVDRDPDSLDRAAERLASQLEALATASARAAAQPHRPVELVDRVDVDRRNPGAASFELERPKALEGADVEHPHAAEVIGDPVVADQAAQVEQPRRRQPGSELLRVVPVDLAEAAAKLREVGLRGGLRLGFHCAQPSRRGVRPKPLWRLRSVRVRLAVAGASRMKGQLLGLGPSN